MGTAPPSGGERGNRNFVQKVLGWLALQALVVWVRGLFDDLF
jgi:hypothetical protein